MTWGPFSGRNRGADRIWCNFLPFEENIFTFDALLIQNRALEKSMRTWWYSKAWANALEYHHVLIHGNNALPGPPPSIPSENDIIPSTAYKLHVRPPVHALEYVLIHGNNAPHAHALEKTTCSTQTWKDLTFKPGNTRKHLKYRKKRQDMALLRSTMGHILNWAV